MPEPYKIPNHPLLVYPDDVDAWLEEMRVDSVSPKSNLGMSLLTAPRIAAMEDLLKDPTQDVTKIAARINVWTGPDGVVWPAHRDSYENPGRLFFLALRDAIWKLPSHHEKLLELIVAMHSLCPSDPPTQPPSFPEVFRDLGSWTSTSSEDNVKQSARESVLGDFFLAKMASRGLSAPDTDPAVKQLSVWLSRGALHLRAYLEHTPWDPDSVTYAYGPDDQGVGEPIEIPSDSDDDSEGDADDDGAGGEAPEPVELIEAESSVRALDYSVLFVEPWIKICGAAFYDACKANETFPCDIPGQNFGSNFGIGKGYCIERWDYWRRRLEEVARTEELQDITRRIARECVEAMNEIQKQKEAQEAKE